MAFHLERNKQRERRNKFNDKAIRGQDLSNKFNQHFLTCGKKLNNTTNIDVSSYIKRNCRDTSYLAPTSALEINKIIESIKSKTAAGPDEIKVDPIKAVASTSSVPLAHVCNCILKDGHFLDELKVARVTPIHRWKK